MMAADCSIKNFIIEDEIGRGTSGRVFKGRPRKSPTELVAIKLIPKKSLSRAAKDNLINEISALKKLKNRFIVNMRDFAWDDLYIYIIMDYCNSGDLNTYIKKRKALPESIARIFCQQLCSALLFMREHNMSHMDLKPSNLLLHRPSPTSPPLLKVADFGFAHCLEERSELGLRGSPLYMAPEIILKQVYDPKVDIWSVGVILYEALFGRAPYSSSSLDQLLVKIKEDKAIVIGHERSISSDCRNFLTRSLERDPELRLNFEEMEQDKFLDLEYSIPSSTSHDKLKEVLNIATAADRNKDSELAVEFYEKAVKYLRTQVYYSEDEAAKIKYRSSLASYKKRYDQLKGGSSDQDSDLLSSKYSLLTELCRVTPGMKDGIEICIAARNYQMEGDLSQAIDRYTAGLGVLMPFLQSEPKGRRRDLLHQAVSEWMLQAESVKSRQLQLAAQTEEQAEERQTGETSEKNCCIQ